MIVAVIARDEAADLIVLLAELKEARAICHNAFNVSEVTAEADNRVNKNGVNLLLDFFHHVKDVIVIEIKG